MSIRYLLWSFLSPSQLILGCIIIGALLLAVGRARAGRSFAVIGGIALLVFGLLPTATYLARPLESRFPRPELPERVDGIVLLAGAERPKASQAYGKPQLGSHGGRYITTLMLAARHPEARIVFSGGPRRQPGRGELETPTAVGAAILSNVAGLDPARLTFDESSRDTCMHPRGVQEHARPAVGQNWVVVTSAIHLPRTIACFRAIGLQVIPYPADYQADPPGWGMGNLRVAKNLALLDLAAHEWVGLAFYRLSGRTSEFFPAP